MACFSFPQQVWICQRVRTRRPLSSVPTAVLWPSLFWCLSSLSSSPASASISTNRGTCIQSNLFFLISAASTLSPRPQLFYLFIYFTKHHRHLLIFEEAVWVTGTAAVSAVWSLRRWETGESLFGANWAANNFCLGGVGLDFSEIWFNNNQLVFVLLIDANNFCSAVNILQKEAARRN